MDNSTLPGLDAATASGDADNPLGSSNGSLSETSAWGISGSGPWLLACMLSLIILMTACGNTLLIALVFAQRSLRNTSNCFLVSLFLSDLMVALVVMPPAMLNVLYGAWVLWPGFCPVWLCFDVMCCSASILNLCVISLDRYLLIISPLRYKQRMTPPRALLLVGGAWGLAALTSFLPIKMNWHSLGHGSGHSPMHGAGSCCLRVTFPFALVASVLTFFLPSSAICFTYCQILLAARRQARRVASVTTSNCSQVKTLTIPQVKKPDVLSVNSERRLAHRQGRRAVKASLTLGVLLGLFFSAWLPFFITNMAQAVCECVPPALFDAITWLGYCNSTMNPIIYPLFMRDFKRALGRLLPYCSTHSPHRPSLALSLSLRNSGEPNLPTEPPSLASDPPQPPATATDAVNLFDDDHAGIELPLRLPNQVDTLD
ncbi:5-hydroxytryptamine receptor 6-like [Oncorhynchus kisutch]|uniref:5-hydroxytryptamine receptor 6-like n=1 Tax=Oncorhynchus kisutch TaxID=8019 RepID=UPI00099FB8E4|nr:5-hydroxytryptamine receptor 6-like [Oncorhynchus kisutch]